MPALTDVAPPAPQKITLEAAMKDESYLRCSLLIYGQQILLIANKIFLPQLNVVVPSISDEYLVILTNTEVIHMRKDRLVTLPQLEFRNDPKWG